MIIIASVVCAIHVRDEYKNETDETTNADHDETQKETTDTSPQKKHGCKHYLKKWLRLVWQKKKIYLQIIPHLFDQATDIGVILTYHDYQDDPDEPQKINTTYLFYVSIAVLVLHRIATSFGVWQLTRNWVNVLLQLLDVLMIRAIWTSYKLGGTEPSTTQRYLGIMEATFEAMPQLLMSTGFIVKTQTFDGLIVISLVSSLWSLTARVSADDKMWIDKYEWKSLNFTYKECPVINWRYVFRVFYRFLEISSKLCLFTLLWINLGGFAAFIVIGFEVLFCVILCVGSKSIGSMGNLMFLHFDNDRMADWADNAMYAFMGYRGVSSIIYLILITIFANVKFSSWKVDEYGTRHHNTMEYALGKFLFLYCWITHFIWPCLGYVVWTIGSTGNSFYDNTTTRDIYRMYVNRNYLDVLELIEFGKNELSDKEKEVLQSITKDADIEAVIQQKAKEMCVQRKIPIDFKY